MFKTTEKLRHKEHRDCDFCHCEALHQSRGATGVPPVANTKSCLQLMNHWLTYKTRGATGVPPVAKKHGRNSLCSLWFSYSNYENN